MRGAGRAAQKKVEDRSSAGYSPRWGTGTPGRPGSTFREEDERAAGAPLLFVDTRSGRLERESADSEPDLKALDDLRLGGSSGRGEGNGKAREPRRSAPGDVNDIKEAFDETEKKLNEVKKSTG